MLEEIFWKRFLCYGRVEDYLKYSAVKKSREISEGSSSAVYDRGACNTGDVDRRERPPYNSPYA